jgi:hypothetical protein
MFFLSEAVHSQESHDHALADVEISYTYMDGGAVLGLLLAEAV